jgi:hypothetical protein
MRILIVTSFFPPLNSIASHRPYSWAKYWSAMGHDVTVLTPGKLRNAKTDLSVSMEGFELLEVETLPFLKRLKSNYHSDSKVDCKLTVERSFGSLIRRSLTWFRRKAGLFDSCHMPDWTDFWVSRAFQTVKARQPWDLVISTVPPFPIHRLAYQIRQCGLAKSWIMDYRDLIVGSPVTNAIFPFNLIEKGLERKYARSADAITTVSKGLQRS